MKKLTPILLLLLFTCAARAEIVNTIALTVRVPDGWASEADGDGSVSLFAPSGACATITAQEVRTEQDKQNFDPMAVATYLFGQFQAGGAPTGKVTRRNGVCAFTVDGTDENGKPSRSEFRFSIEKDKWFVMVMVQNGASDLTIEQVLRSVRYH